MSDNKRVPHKHADLIKAWADGARIEWKNPSSERWIFVPEPGWLPMYEYRVARPTKTEYYQAFWLESPITGSMLLTNVPASELKDIPNHINTLVARAWGNYYKGTPEGGLLVKELPI